MQKVVVIAPHPDDEVIGCGGSLIKHARAGNAITVITVGERLTCPREADLTPTDYTAESNAAHEILGVRRHVDLAFPARTMVATHDVIFKIVRELRIERPDIIYLPHEAEADAEHREAGRATGEAIWMAQSVYFEEHGPPMPAPALVLGYEVWTPLSRYQYVEDIQETIAAKLEAMRAYQSQLRHGDWPAAIEGLAAYRGVTTGAGRFAEVFAVLHIASGRAFAAR